MISIAKLLLPPGWDASPSQGSPQHFDGTHLYNWVERGTVRVKPAAHGEERAEQTASRVAQPFSHRVRGTFGEKLASRGHEEKIKHV